MPKKHLGMLLIVISALIASIPFSLPVIEKEAALEKGPRVAMEQKVQIRKTTRGKEKKSFWPQEAYRTLFAGSLPYHRIMVSFTLALLKFSEKEMPSCPRQRIFSRLFLRESQARNHSHLISPMENRQVLLTHATI
jgi:hypothetical protein